MNTKNVGIYIHIPFCKHKCRYCDFKSYSGKEAFIENYIKWVNQELIIVGDGNKLDYENGLDKLAIIDTIYLGGGTPSYIESHYIVQLLETIRNHYTLIEKPEITIEVNPGTVTKEKLQDYIKAGVNRISIGLQSSKDVLLKQLGRIHTYEEFEQAFQMAKEVGFKNINVDLMIGLPKQSLEEGTPLYNDVEEGKVELPSEELERCMYWKVKEMLEKSGYAHYEISNFAKEGYASKHNMNCWNQEEYFGIGAAAHSYTNHVRFSNVDTIEQYIKNFEEGHDEDNLIFHEKQNLKSMMQEYMILSLRKIEGVKIQEFKKKFSENPIYLYRKELEKLVNEELIEIDGDYIRLTKKGLDFANIVWEEFV